MTVTQAYTRTHAVYRRVARGLELSVHDVRVLVAVYEHGDREGLRMDRLVAELGRGRADYAPVRRSVGVLYASGHAEGRASGGGPRRPGSLTVVSLTASGRAAARRAVELVQDGERAAVAA